MPKSKRCSSISLSPDPEPSTKRAKSYWKADQRKPRTRRQAYVSAPQTGSHILFLFVGEPYQLLTVHTNLLPEATKAYLNTRFYAEQVCWLREEDPTIANLWRLYLYTGSILSDNEAADQDPPDTGNEDTNADGEWTELAHAYLFGRKVQDEGFANACVTALIEKVQETEHFPTGIASEVYACTRPGDRLRNLLVDLHV